MSTPNLYPSRKTHEGDLKMKDFNKNNLTYRELEDVVHRIEEDKIPRSKDLKRLVELNTQFDYQLKENRKLTELNTRLVIENNKLIKLLNAVKNGGAGILK